MNNDLKISQSEWNKYVDHPLQSYAWGEFRKKTGVTVVRTHYWQITFHHIPRTPFTIGYFPKGPMPTEEMCKELIEIGKRQHAIYIQLEPNIIKNSQLVTRNSQLHLSYHSLFTKYTFILDLTKSEDELLSAMHPKTRYNIKVAQKHGIVVGEDNSDTAFAAYLKLSKETTARQRFYAHNDTYHRTMWPIMRDAGIAKLWTASYQGTILAAWIIFIFKDTVYYPYGASSRLHRETMAPNLLLWEIAKWGVMQGYKKFDLWGALGPPSADGPDPNDPWYGFHRFKEGYHPQLIEYVGSYDLVINPLLYKLYCVGDSIRWALLKYKTKF